MLRVGRTAQGYADGDEKRPSIRAAMKGSWSKSWSCTSWRGGGGAEVVVATSPNMAASLGGRGCWADSVGGTVLLGRCAAGVEACGVCLRVGARAWAWAAAGVLVAVDMERVLVVVE